jgi:hypothetical protein
MTPPERLLPAACTSVGSPRRLSAALNTAPGMDEMIAELEAILEAKPVEITCRHGSIGMNADRKLLKNGRHRNP